MSKTKKDENNKKPSKKKDYHSEITQGEDPFGNEAYGLIIWLNTKNREKAEKLSDEIIDKLNGEKDEKKAKKKTCKKNEK